MAIRSEKKNKLATSKLLSSSLPPFSFKRKVLLFQYLSAK